MAIMFNVLTSLTSYLQSRRSCRPRNLIEPGPDDRQIREIVTTALRTPDHGKLAPWRVVSVSSDQRGTLADCLKQAYLKETPRAGSLELEAMDNLAVHAPALLVVLFSPVESSKIPAWEQQLSCGAFCMNILHAAHSEGYVGGWITGWPAYNDDVRDLFGTPPERVAGFLYLGTPDGELSERARPVLDDVLSNWQPVAS